jgi:hypothetical protein
MSNESTNTAPPTGYDERFNIGLLYDVFKVLEQHGYQKPEESPGAIGRSLLALGDLVRVFEGGEAR